jgi:hypothetical protein
MSLTRSVEPKVKEFRVTEKPVYEVSIEELGSHPISRVVPEHPESHEEATARILENSNFIKPSERSNEIPYWNAFDTAISSNIREFINCAQDVRNNIRKTGKLTLTSELVEFFLRQLMSGHRIEVITDQPNVGCCGWNLDVNLKKMTVYIDKKEFSKNYEELFNTLFLSYGLDMEYAL